MGGNGVSTSRSQLNLQTYNAQPYLVAQVNADPWRTALTYRQTRPTPVATFPPGKQKATPPPLQLRFKY
jgi:hypothetical protein